MQLLERPCRKSKRELWVKGNCEPQLDTLAEAARPRPHGIDFQKYRPNLAEHCPALGCQCRPMARSIEEGDPQLVLKIADRVADGRLDAPQAPCACTKASGLGHGNESPHLIEGKRVQADRSI